MAKWLSQVGVSTPEQLIREDPFVVYRRLRVVNSKVTLNALYAIIGAIEGQNWLEIKRQRRMEILLRLEQSEEKNHPINYP